METNPNKRQSILQQEQTQQLFNALNFSSIGSILVALVMVLIIGPNTNKQIIWSWFLALIAVSLYRWLSVRLYNHLSIEQKLEKNRKHQFFVGAYLAAFTWGASMWMFFPVEYPEYQVLMILILAGVAAGATSTLSYDRFIITVFMLIMLLMIESRLLWEGSRFSYELGVLIFLYFAFLIKGGRDIGRNYLELLTLRHDVEDHNLTLLSTTESIARIGYWQWDMESEHVEISANLAAMYGIGSCAVKPGYLIEKVHDDDRSRVQSAIDTVLDSDKEASVEFRLWDMNTQQWVIMNQVIKRVTDPSDKPFILGTVQDISLIKSAEQKVFDMAYYDELTGLANRGHFRQHLQEQIKHAVRNDLNLALLYIDLDGFKEINDSLGHDKGDTFLKYFADQLKLQVREEDFIARLGGDEFCIVLGHISDGVSTAQTAERCLALKHKSIEIENQSISPQMSIGIAVYPQDGTEVDSLLRAADAAMYSAKYSGKHRYAFYDTQMTEDAAVRLKLESDLQQALKNDEFMLVYQPKISLTNNLIKGVEALIRWQHPERGFVPPDEFINTAERIGLINEIGEWVLQQSCMQLQRWKKQGINLDMAVNVSSSHFSADGFVAHVAKVVDDFNLSDGELEVEITESMSRDPQKHIQICRELNELGVKVAIDDFGTGYSSLSVLKQLEVDTLKIDQAFIMHLPHDKPSAMMVTAIVNMANGLGFDIVAEGVETAEQAEFLTQLGSPYVQGYFFSKPVLADEIPALYHEAASAPADQEVVTA